MKKVSDATLAKRLQKMAREYGACQEGLDFAKGLTLEQAYKKRKNPYRGWIRRFIRAKLVQKFNLDHRGSEETCRACQLDKELPQAFPYPRWSKLEPYAKKLGLA